MATVTRNILNEGPSKIVIQVVIEGDSGGELLDYLILDPSTDFSPSNMQSPNQSLALMQMWGSTVWFDVAVKFNAIAKTTAWVHARDASNYYDFRYIGGLKDQSTEDPDGKVLLSTNGLDLGSVGVLIMEFKKN